MQRQTMMRQVSATTYDGDGSVLSHWEGETQTVVPLHREPEVFAAFTRALRDGDNVLDVAERFGSDHCTVLYWKRRLAFTGQLDVAAGVDQ